MNKKSKMLKNYYHLLIKSFIVIPFCNISYIYTKKDSFKNDHSLHDMKDQFGFQQYQMIFL
jgi:hypothetical protein